MKGPHLFTTRPELTGVSATFTRCSTCKYFCSFKQLYKVLTTNDAHSYVVYGQRRRREGESAFKLATASVFYRMLRSLASIDMTTSDSKPSASRTDSRNSPSTTKPSLASLRRSRVEASTSRRWRDSRLVVWR